MSDSAPANKAGQDPLDYPETRDQAAEYLRLVLMLLSKHSISPNPVNYAVLYDYQAGYSEHLRKALDQVLGLGEGLPAEKAKELYRHFVYNCDERLMEKYRDDLLRITAETLGSLTDFAGKTSLSSNVLETHAADLAGSSNMKEVLNIVAGIIAETRSLVRDAREMEANLTASADEVQLLREELARVKEEAITDGLTGLLNRRAFERSMNRSIDRSLNCVTPFCLLMLDIDHFKKVNDAYGHIIGDKVLRSVAELLTKAVKGRDQVARIGGEEFAILLPDTQLNGAKRVAEDIRQQVAKARLRRIDTGEVLTEVTISIGVAICRKLERAEGLFERCDRALYLAKRRGRNRVEVAG